MSAFITNGQHKTLKSRVKNLIKFSDELNFLVGYFYFSGIQELYQAIKDRYDSGGKFIIKIVVGLQVDSILNRVNEVAEEIDETLSTSEKKDLFFNSLKKGINNRYLDNENFYTQVEFFIEMIKENRLIIRKTETPNHAKLYIFKTANTFQDLIQGAFITGSSNLTTPGLVKQNEFNVEIKDYGLDEAKRYFDNLWENSIELTEDDVAKDRLLTFFEKKSQVSKITPFEAYAMILKNYVELQKGKKLHPNIDKILEKNGYKKFSYQIDAVNQAINVIENYNGVIVADVVGLGKSVIGSLIAKNLGKRGIVIAPPGLLGDSKRKDSGWYQYLDQFQLYDWDCYSSGALEDLSEYVSENRDSFDVVIVDEAHRFRNEETSSYELLSNITKDKKVILLTATPFNNKPNDIFSLLKLFIIPKKSGITIDNDLETKFNRYENLFYRCSYIIKNYNSTDNRKRIKALNYYKNTFDNSAVFVDINIVENKIKSIAMEIKSIIAPVVIRRNRLDLKNDKVYKNEIDNLSKIKNPEEIFFQLDKKQNSFYDDVIKKYFGKGKQFTGAIYQPFIYEERNNKKLGEEDKNSQYYQQKNLYDFMKRLIVKRFESSFGAFKKSIENFKKSHEIVLDFIENSGGKYILDRKLIENIYDKSEDEITQELERYVEKYRDLEKSKNSKIYNVNNFFYKDKFLNNIKKDLELFNKILDKIEKLKLIDNDPKVKAVITKVEQLLKKEPKRKVIIFTEYLDSVKHIKKYFEEKFKNKILSIDKDLNKKLITTIYENFDASYSKNGDNSLKILIATDKLSEGFNLNKAGTIINYDIPWNPTRVIQRVGRINRIGVKVFEELYIFNIFPTQVGNDVIKSREIATQKMFLIHNSLGEDSKIFSPNEIPTKAQLYSKINSNPDKLDDENFITDIRNRYKDIENNYPEVIKNIENYPNLVKTAKFYDKDQIVVFKRKGVTIFVQTVIKDKNGKKRVKNLPFEQIIKDIESKFDQKRVKFSENFWDNYNKIKNYIGSEIDIDRKNENATEVKAFNNLMTAVKEIRIKIKDGLNLDINIEYQNILEFISLIIKDMREYQSLPKYTIKRLLKYDAVKNLDKFIEEIKAIKKIFGGNYIKNMKTRVEKIKLETIIAIENIKK